MKYSARQYAIALIEACEELGAEKFQEIFDRWILLIEEQGKLTMLPSILVELENYFKKDITEVNVSSPKPLSAELRLWIKDYLGEKLKTDKFILREKIDQSLLAGLKLRYADKELNLSLSGVLKQLSNQITD